MGFTIPGKVYIRYKFTIAVAWKVEMIKDGIGFVMNQYVKNLNRIEFIVTLACTGKCKHCSEGDHASFSEYIHADAAAKAIRQVCQNYQIKSLMTFGGEPLLYPEVVCEIHRTAKAMGIQNRDLITNGFFSKDKTRIKEVANMLADSGVCKILLSVDAFHQETIPLEPVIYFAECVLAAGIPVKLSPAWLVSREDDNPYNKKTREILGKFTDLKIPIGAGNVISPRGNASKYLSEYFDDTVEYASPYDENPSDIRAICFSPNGDVLNDNIYRKDILDILNEYRP